MLFDFKQLAKIAVHIEQEIPVLEDAQYEQIDSNRREEDSFATRW